MIRKFISMRTNPLYKLSYGLYLITSRKGQKLNGYIANTAFQVTADPPQIAISCHKDNLTTEYIEKSGVFAISVLAQDASNELIQKFGYTSGDSADKFKGLKYQTGLTKAPIVLENTIAWFDCKVTGTFNAGSHIVFFGEVVNSELIDDDKIPMTYDYYRNVKNALVPKRAPTFIKVDPQSYGVTTSDIGDGDAESYEAPTGGRDDNSIEGSEVGAAEHLCIICGYSYDPEEGDPNNRIPQGTAFEDLPDDWVCPVCRAGTEYFKAM